MRGIFFQKTHETLEVYWDLLKIIVPVTIFTQVLVDAGVVEAVSPVLEPLMGLYGLPADMALVWLTGMLVGVWAAVVLVFALVPIELLTVADMTVFSALLLFAHGLPIEQKIIQKAGPGFLVTTLLRVAGGALYALLLCQIYRATGWLSQPLDPVWIPMAEVTGWGEFFASLLETLFWMLVIFLALAWLMEGLKASGLMRWLDGALAPLFRFAGIRGEARQFTAVGLVLGVSYGSGLLIREARKGQIPPRQIFLSCVFMGFAHGVIEDTLVVMALGADFSSIFVGRLVFAVLATALIARIIAKMPDGRFFPWMFDPSRIAGAASGRSG